MELNRVYHGDCLALMKKLDAGSVDLVFADPPFNIGYDYDAYDDRRAADDYLDWSRQWIEGVIRVLKPTGTFWLAIGDEYAAELKVLCARDLRLHCRSWVVWYYTFGVHCTRKFTRSHAHLFHFVKNAKRFTFNAAAVRVPSARQLVYADKRANPQGRMPDDTWLFPVPPASDRTDKPDASPPDRQGAGAAPSAYRHNGWILRPQDLPDGFDPQENTWYFSRVCGTFSERAGWHGCQMPEQLLGRIIRVSSNEGDVILDPFGGSGTTLAVAKKLGRRHVGFELSTSYATMIDKRLAVIKAGDALVGPENAAVSAPPTKIGRTLRRTAKSRRASRDGEVFFALGA